MSSKRIGIDIDDVLSVTIPNLLRLFKDRLSLEIKYEDFRNYKFFETEVFKNLKIDKVKAHDLWNDFSNSHYGKDMGIVDGSHEGLLRLISRGYEIHLITARWQELKENTHSWISNRFPGVDFAGIHFTGILYEKSIDKSVVCKNLGIGCMIEDNAENCLDLAENGIKSYLIERPWNKDYIIENPLIKRVNNWNEIDYE